MSIYGMFYIKLITKSFLLQLQYQNVWCIIIDQSLIGISLFVGLDLYLTDQLVLVP